MATKRCPVCNVPVKVENLERHVRTQHPRANVDTRALLTEEERQALQEAKTAARPTLTSRGKRTIVLVAIVVAAVLLIGIIAATWRPSGGNPGNVAPDFTLPTSEGGTITLSSYRGQPVLLEFMDVDCPFCQQEAEQALTTLYQNYGARVQFLCVDIDLPGDPPADTADRINSFRAQYNTPWPYGMDSSRTVASSYGVTGTPTTFIVDKEGIIRNRFDGLTGYANLASALDAVLRS